MQSNLICEGSTPVTTVGACAMLTDFCLKWPQRLEPRSGRGARHEYPSNVIGNNWNRSALSTRQHALRHRHLASVSDAILNRAVHQIGFSWIVGIPCSCSPICIDSKRLTSEQMGYTTQMCTPCMENCASHAHFAPLRICIPSDMHLLDLQRGSDRGSSICCAASSDSILVIFMCRVS